MIESPTRDGAIYVGKCSLGSGVFAGRNFRKSEFLFRFSGPAITLAEAIAKGEAEGNVLQIGARSYVDLEAPGVFGNHSCRPNAGLREEICCYALRDITEGEEILYDYSTTMSERRWTMQCKCGTSGCRKVIGDFHDLPLGLRRRYLSMGIVQPFILDELKLAGGPKKRAMSLSSRIVENSSHDLQGDAARIARYAPC